LIIQRGRVSCGWELDRCLQQWLRALAEEADRSFDVLGICREEELLANKL
jgi:hypothetical protein